MAPEYGATCGIFPIDSETINYLRLTGRDEDQLQVVEAYARAQGMWLEDKTDNTRYTDVIELDMSTVVLSISGPKRPQDRIELPVAKQTVHKHLQDMKDTSSATSAHVKLDNNIEFDLSDGDIVIAAITSCTNTSNPAVMLGAGLVARNAVAKGLKQNPGLKPVWDLVHSW